MDRTKVHISGLSGVIFGRHNRLCNGDFRIDQVNAGAAVTPAANAYVCDNAFLIISAASKLTTQRVSGSLTKYPWSLKTSTATAYTPGTSEKNHLNMFIEGLDFGDLLWGTNNAKPITISFTIKVNRAGKYGFSLCAVAGYPCFVFTKTLVAGENEVVQVISGCTTGTWSTLNVASLVLRFDLGCGATYHTTQPEAWISSNVLTTADCVQAIATQGNSYEISGVQVEAGTVATPFEFLPYQQALAWCQRYFQKSYDVDVPPGSINTSGALCNRCVGVPEWNGFIHFRSPMRTMPTITIYSPVTGAAGYVRQYDGTAADKVAHSDYFNGTGSIRIYATCDAVNQFAACHWVADARM